jgi:hypothetical protein
MITSHARAGPVAFSPRFLFPRLLQSLLQPTHRFLLLCCLFVSWLSCSDSRQNMDEVNKIKEQIAAIWDKAREAQGL